MAKETKELNLHQKILKIADMAGVLQKSKAGYSYKYVPEEDIQAKVTAGLQKYGVMLYDEIVPGTLQVTPYHYEKLDARTKTLKPYNEIIVSADVVYTWVNVDNPEEKICTPWAFVGQMEDAAQAMGAGLTYSNRYYLMKQLQLATTEADPDNYRSKQKQAEDYINKGEFEAKLKEVVDKGKDLIKANKDNKDKMMKIVSKYNNGNGNPSSITSIEVCEKILEELKTLEKTNENKGDLKE